MSDAVETYYSHTAYDSKHLQPLTTRYQLDDVGFHRRQFLRWPLPDLRGVHCGEYFGSSDEIYTLKQLKAEKEQIREELKEPYQEQIFWSGLQNPKVALYLSTQVLLITAVIFAIGGLLLFGIGLFIKPSGLFTYQSLELLGLVLSPTILYHLGKFILKTGKIRDKNNIVFNRRKGTVFIPDKKGGKELPFGEFKAYMSSGPRISGSVDYHLRLVHIGNEGDAQHPHGFSERWPVLLEWEFTQQYMDISMPLPDVPSMEPFRQKDPVTAAWDRKHNRPPRYWRDIKIEKAKSMHDAAYKAASRYPWGATREQALAAGWKPSGFGKGDWNKTGDSQPAGLARSCDRP